MHILSICAHMQSEARTVSSADRCCAWLLTGDDAIKLVSSSSRLAARAYTECSMVRRMHLNTHGLRIHVYVHIYRTLLHSKHFCGQRKRTCLQFCGCKVTTCTYTVRRFASHVHPARHIRRSTALCSQQFILPSCANVHNRIAHFVTVL